MRSSYALLLGSWLLAAPSMAQIAPQPAPDPATLLTSADPHAAANKKLVYDFYREVLEAGHLDNMQRQ